MKKTGYVAGILFSVVTASFVGQAVGAPGEPSQLEQAEELSTTSDESRCPFQQTVYQMIGVFVDNITLDYQGQALQIRVLGSENDHAAVVDVPRKGSRRTRAAAHELPWTDSEH